MNSKAQLGNITATFPSFIFLVLIMAVFIVLSTTAFLIKQPKQIPYAITPSTAMLTDTLEIELNSQKKQITLLDAIILQTKDEILRERISESLAKQINGDTKCAFVIVNGEYYAAFYNPQKEKVETITYTPAVIIDFFTILKKFNYDVEKAFEQNSVHSSLNLNNEKINLITYKGDCQ